MTVPDVPLLTGPRLRIRPAGSAALPPRDPVGPGDASGDPAALLAILAEPSVLRWWGAPPPVSSLLADLAGESEDHLLVIESGGQVVGGIAYAEETEPMYRHAGIDVFLGAAAQGRGLGREAVALLAGWLIESRGHHRLTIDPAAGNTRAIGCYAAVGFRPVGVLRAYERGPDGAWRDGLLMDLLADELIRP